MVLSAVPAHAALDDDAVSAGKALFLAMKCTECHDADKQINGPPLKTIAAVYGEKERLLNFMRSDVPYIVEPARSRTMEPRRRKLKALKPEEQDALATFLMSHK
ncbi:MAG: hypothetical protein BWK76_25630 [Desulfobulbaceae bacterium A2]|nr:MAG: hypothetical protein BWK76_25630 [Desulfobulbaceae bacterium A2]